MSDFIRRTKLSVVNPICDERAAIEARLRRMYSADNTDPACVPGVLEACL